MAKDFLIYALTDPAGQVRYIGKSVNGLTRARKHLQPAQMERRCYRNSWLKSLQASGQAPGIVVLERGSDAAGLNDLERFWIAQGLGLGWRLTNQTPGGDGNSFMFGNRYAAGRRLSAAMKEKLRTANIGNRYAAGAQSTERRKVTSEALRRFWAVPANKLRMRAAQKRKHE